MIPQGTDYTLQWSHSIDNVDNQLDYEILINGVLKGTTQLNSFILTNINEENNLITVQAKDEKGNRSVSNTIILKKCPSNLIISTNEAINNQIIIKKAINLIEATNSILGQSQVIYQSGKNIILNPGFNVNTGNVFLAKIVGCDN